jgi:hypothetical protein
MDVQADHRARMGGDTVAIRLGRLQFVETHASIGPPLAPKAAPVEGQCIEGALQVIRLEDRLAAATCSTRRCPLVMPKAIRPRRC